MSAKAVKALGLDLGSTTMKMVAVDAGGKMAWHLLEPAEPKVEEQVAHFIESAERETGFSNHLPLVATGYGRNLAKQADKTVTEITCHARGVFREYDHGGTLIDIGGQDSKVISISAQGKVIDFAMNDKCAAGTGRFLENTAARLGVPLEEMGSSALSTEEEVSISSTCTVFAESEIVSLIARGIAVPPILRGLHRSLIKRIGAMVMAVGIAPPLMLSGGVVLNPAIQHMLANELSQEVLLPRHPQLMGAYGAALIALGM